ncbi:hypothetical protein OSTOST_08567, partial [Ostertagia ostertagi]
MPEPSSRDQFIFIDEDFKRPFFTAYVKTCMLTVYMVRYLVFEKPEQHVYKVLENELSDCESIDMGGHSLHVYKVLENELSDCESIDMGGHSLTMEGFETMTSDSEVDTDRTDGVSRSVRFAEHRETMEGFETMTSDSEVDTDRTDGVSRSVRFAEHREVRRMPSVEAHEARLARQPYSPPIFDCNFSINLPRNVKYTVFFFAPMWLICTFTYQTALVFTSVSALNLISSSSSLFVLVFSICFPSTGSSFTLLKAFLVALNLGGVFLVSQFSSSFRGTLLAQVSAVSYALYITLYTRYQEKNGEIGLNLMFGE